MQNTSNRTSPQEYNNHRGSGQHYPEYYETSNHHNNNTRHSPTKDRAGAQDLPVQNHKRVTIADKHLPANSNNSLPNRGIPNDMSRPPTYPGPSYEDPAMHQQSKRRGYRRTDSEEVQYHAQNTNSPPTAGKLATMQNPNSRAETIPNQSMPMARDRDRDQRQGSSPKNSSPKRQQRAESPEPVVSTARAESIQIKHAAAGAGIERLESPRVMTSVLLPLDGKVKEYNTRMQNAQAQMTQLDAEIAALMEKKRLAEKRYMEAKTKHDDYRRQYQGVERAMKGEPEIIGLPAQRMSYDSEDDRPPSQQTIQQTPTHHQEARGPNTRTESWNSGKKSNNKSGSRFSVSKMFRVSSSS